MTDNKIPEEFKKIAKTTDVVSAGGNVHFIATPYKYIGSGLTVMACYDFMSGNYFGVTVGGQTQRIVDYSYYRFKTFRPDDHKDLQTISLEKCLAELDHITYANYLSYKNYLG